MDMGNPFLGIRRRSPRSGGSRPPRGVQTAPGAVEERFPPGDRAKTIGSRMLSHSNRAGRCLFNRSDAILALSEVGKGRSTRPLCTRTLGPRPEQNAQPPPRLMHDRIDRRAGRSVFRLATSGENETRFEAMPMQLHTRSRSRRTSWQHTPDARDGSVHAVRAGVKPAVPCRPRLHRRFENGRAGHTGDPAARKKVPRRRSADPPMLPIASHRMGVVHVVGRTSIRCGRAAAALGSRSVSTPFAVSATIPAVSIASPTLNSR